MKKDQKMNYHSKALTAHAENGSKVDLTKIEVGSLVYCSSNDVDEAGGAYAVVKINGDRVGGNYMGTDKEEWFDLDRIADHVEEAFVMKSGAVAGSRDDRLVRQWWAEVETLIPLEAELWANSHAAHEAWDAERAAAGIDITDRAGEALPSYAAYLALSDEYYRQVGHRIWLLCEAIEHSKMRTVTGFGIKAKATAYRLFEYGGGNWNGDEVEQKAFAEELYEFACKHDRPAPLVEAPLGDLIEAHRLAQELFSDSCDPYGEADFAWSKDRAANPIITPVRIVDGKVVKAETVTGQYPDEEVEMIEAAHSQWAFSLGLNRKESVSEEAHRVLSKQIDASLQECLRVYEQETSKTLEERFAPYRDAIEAHNAASEAEAQALDALLRYQPKSLSEVKALATYLLKTDQLGEMGAGPEAATLLRTFASTAA